MGYLRDKSYDSVRRPAHYVDGRKYEPVKVIQDWELDYCMGAALKYIARAGRKPGANAAEDLMKAMQYLKFEIDNLVGEE